MDGELLGILFSICLDSPIHTISIVYNLYNTFLEIDKKGEKFVAEILPELFITLCQKSNFVDFILHERVQNVWLKFIKSVPRLHYYITYIT